MVRDVARRAGFTLVEMLVVVAVIAVLMGVLLPSLAAAQRQARTTQCLTQARSVSQALNAFGTANGQRFPENRPLLKQGQHVTWRHVLQRDGYLAEPAAWVCPDAPATQSELGQYDNGTLCVGDVPSNYAINGHVLWRLSKRREEADRNEAAIRRPAHTVLIAETRGAFPDLRVTNHLLSLDFEDGAGYFGYWHKGAGTYAFHDGHAETIKLMDTGNPDCRWHNGKDLEIDAVNKQTAEETRTHDHPDWQYLVGSVYLDQ